MVARRTVLGKQGGYLDVLVVRAYRYRDSVINALLHKITRLWDWLEIPQNTKVITIHFAPKWVHYSSAHHCFPLIGRYYYAVNEWQMYPAKWLIIVDGDVIPTRRSALFELCNFVTSQQNADVITRHIVTDWFRLPAHTINWVLRVCRTSLAGISVNTPSEGIICFRFPTIKFLSTILSYYQQPYMWSELRSSTLIPPSRIVELPPYLCELRTPNEHILVTHNAPAFYHFSSEHKFDYAKFSRIINDAWERLKEG